MSSKTLYSVGYEQGAKLRKLPMMPWVEDEGIAEAHAVLYNRQDYVSHTPYFVITKTVTTTETRRV